MSNMSYCRFENTLADLEDCESNFDSTESIDEAQAAIDLYRLCVTISRTYSLSDLEARLAELQDEDEDEDEDEDQDQDEE
jgi:hypothetical protein